MPTPLHARALAAASALLLLALAGCSGDSDAEPAQGETEQVVRAEVGDCRVLTPAAVASASDDTATVDCTEDHTAETYAAGEIPEEQADLDWDSPELAAWAYETCAGGFADFLRADESTVMRTILSWAWFRPTEEAWEAGERHYRCDVVGGGEQVVELRDLPETAEGLLEGIPDDRWMVCASGPRVSGSTKVACDEEHTWRAVTTIKVGDAEEGYPGDRFVEITTRDYCSDSVGGWLGYPDSYDYGYTYFGEAEWGVGNRRSVCWAKTAQ